MRAAVVKTSGEPLVVAEVPLPTPGPRQALVKVITTGVCHTDLHAARGDWPVAPKADLIPGHEGYGEVVAGDVLAVRVTAGPRGPMVYEVRSWDYVVRMRLSNDALG